MGSQGFRRTRKLCRAQQSSITRSRTPSFHSRIRSFTMRQRFTLLLTCSIRSRRWWSAGGGQLLLQSQLLTAWLLRRHEDLHLRERERQEAQILQQPTPSREWVGGGLSDAQIMDTAAVGVAQKEDDEERIDQQDIFDGVVLVLAALTCGLLRRVLGADDAPFGPVMGTRGEAGAAAGMGATGVDSSSGGTTTVAASASELPRRWARAGRGRAGASPRGRSAASNTGHRTWIHGL